MTIRVLKLKTGEEIIAEVLYFDNDDNILTSSAIDIINPIQLVVQATQTGFGMMMLPWGSVEGEIHILREDIIYAGQPKADLLEKYERAFSKLAVPEKSLLL